MYLPFSFQYYLVFEELDPLTPLELGFLGNSQQLQKVTLKYQLALQCNLECA